MIGLKNVAFGQSGEQSLPHYAPGPSDMYGPCGKPGCCPDGTPKPDYISQCLNNQKRDNEMFYTNPRPDSAYYERADEYPRPGKKYLLDWCSNYDYTTSTFNGCGEI